MTNMEVVHRLSILEGVYWGLVLLWLAWRFCKKVDRAALAREWDLGLWRSDRMDLALSVRVRSDTFC